MKRRKSKKGLATLCIGGGMGISMCMKMSYKNIKTQSKNSIGTVTISRERKNSLDIETSREIYNL